MKSGYRARLHKKKLGDSLTKAPLANSFEDHLAGLKIKKM